MKAVKLLVILLLTSLCSFSQIYRADVYDNNLVNQYGSELQALKKKYHLPTAFGFSKSITNRDGSLYETIIVWYRTEAGETEDKIVSARVIHFKEGTDKPKDSVTQKEIVQNGQKIIVRDTITVIKRDTVIMEEIVNTDSLTFKSKRVLKNKNGYVITGNVNDRGVQIPVVLNTYKEDYLNSDGTDRRFGMTGYAVYYASKAVATAFNSTKPGGPILIKLLKKDTNGWTNSQKDPCYSEEFIVTPEFWYSQRINMSWQKQVDYMKINFPKID
jgi:hypothetical protein